MPRPRPPAWTAQELAILQDVYSREGINGSVDALPDRSWTAICVMASKLGIRSPVIGKAPEPALSGARLETAILRREQDGWSFARIGAEMGISESAACNAVLIALCPRKGFTPAQRDDHGRLTAAGLERLRLALRKGMKAVDIQLQLGVSASCVAEQRRRYRADLKSRGKAALPPPGGGTAYSGVRITKEQTRKVETLLMDGLGAKLISERSGVSNTTVGRIRNRLVKRLRRKGETLPGCDRDGRRITAALESRRYLPAASVEELRRRILNGEPVARAARDLGIGTCSAYRIRDLLAADLAAAGQHLPRPTRLGRSPEARARAEKSRWLPADRFQQYREMSAEHGPKLAKDMLRAQMAEERQAEASRPLTFADKLARIASGKASISPTFKHSRQLADVTLGGVATGLLI